MKPYADIYLSEIDSFYETGKKFLAGELTVPAFKSKSGGFGVYAQRNKQGFMIRLRVPCGVISDSHMKLIYGYLQQYDLKGIHLTTREAVQLHDLTLEDVCEIMKDAIHHDLFTRGGGGNFPRNVALSPMSGVEKGEAFDVSEFALAASEYFIANASTYHLPRKLKAAFSNSDQDSALATINDIGFVACVKDNEPYFRVYLGGGMGKNAELAVEYPDLIHPWEAMYCIEAYIRLFIEHGNYQNHGRARSRYIKMELGEEAFIKEFTKHLERVKKTEHFEDIQAVIEKNEEWTPLKADTLNVKAQKQRDLYTVILHPSYGILSTTQYGTLLSFLDEAKKDCDHEHKPDIRISMDQELYIRNLSMKMVERLQHLLPELFVSTEFMVSFSCIGVPTCQIGIQNSRALLQAIVKLTECENFHPELMPKIHISGCPNSCSRHQVAALGFAGRKASAHGEIIDVFDVFAGGKVGVSKTKMGKNYGTVRSEQIPAFLLELSEQLDEYEVCFEKFLADYEDKFNSLIQPFLFHQSES